MSGVRQLLTLSIGGSIVVPSSVDVRYLRRLRTLILQSVGRGTRFLLTVGGGALARQRQADARAAGVLGADALHRIGISACLANARFVSEVLGSVADPRLYPSLCPPARLRFPVTLFVPDGPGFSTDTNAVNVAVRFGCSMLFNLTNISRVFTRDPRRFSSAKPLGDLTWSQYLRLIPATVTPGLKTPFDPEASRRARSAGMTVIILDGRNLPNLRRALAGQRFVGTTIHP